MWGKPYKCIFKFCFRAILAIFCLTACNVQSHGFDEEKEAVTEDYESYKWRYMISEQRSRIYYPDEVLELLEIEPGDEVADIDLGAGYWTFRFARAVGPEGRVYGIDLDPGFMPDLWAYLFDRITDREVNPYDNVSVSKSLAGGVIIGLPRDCLDLAFMCQSGVFLFAPDEIISSDPTINALRRSHAIYQHQFVKSIYDALKPGGRLAVIDMIENDVLLSNPVYPGGKVFGPFWATEDPEAVVKRYEEIGFRFVRGYDIFRDQAHRKDIRDIRRTRFFKEMPDKTKPFYYSEMFFYIFEKPE